MGDRRFDREYDAARDAGDPARHLSDMSDAAVVEALAAASRRSDPYLANVLATEATNRMDRSRLEMRSLAEGVCSLDLDGRIKSANPAAEELLGWRQGELVGQDFDSLCRDGDRDGARRAEHGEFLSAIATGIVVECDTERFFRRDGTTFAASYTAAPIIRSGAITGAVIAFRDASSRRKAEDQLRESEARYRSLFENNPDFVVSTDIAGSIVDASASALDISGHEAAELRGRSFESIACEGDVGLARELFALAIAGKAARRPISLLCKDGTSVHVSLLAIPIVLEGEIVGVYGIAERHPVVV
ncbi:MAG TPA: PAS domain S-box protein [Candidatus Thermoplasmatota archaeon]|nr:PAS domain S-box protein [Candidatus Thermoplasmatota archaeon]